MRVAIVIWIMALMMILAEDAMACEYMPNVVNLDTPNLSTVYVEWLYSQGYFSSPYDNCNCLYSPYVAWDE